MRLLPLLLCSACATQAVPPPARPAVPVAPVDGPVDAAACPAGMGKVLSHGWEEAHATLADGDCFFFDVFHAETEEGSVSATYDSVPAIHALQDCPGAACLRIPDDDATYAHLEPEDVHCLPAAGPAAPAGSPGGD